MARTNDVWETGGDGTYIQTIGSPNGYDVLINGSNHYINFDSVVGTSGYGFRDNSGIMEFKNSGGTWTAIGSGGGATIGGTIAATQVAFGSAADTIAGSANFIWTNASKLLTLTNAGIAITPTDSILLQNTALSTTSVRVQISPAQEFSGHMWQASNSTDHIATFREYIIPISGNTAGQTTAGTLQWDVSKDGTYTLNIMNLSRAGILTTSGGFLATNGSLNLTNGSVTASGNVQATDGQIIAGRELVTGTNGGSFGGSVYFLGLTSGNYRLNVPAVITTYSTTVPAAQGLTGQIWRSVAGDGRWEWTSQLEDTSGISALNFNLRQGFDASGFPVLDFANLAGTMTFGDVGAAINGTQLYIQDGNKKMVFRVGGSDDATFDGANNRFILNDLVSVKSTQYETPATGATVTFAAGKEVMTINPAGAILALTIAFPATPADGETRSFNSTQAVTTLTLSGGTFVGGLTSIALAGFATYVYSSGDSKWHRQG